MTEMPVGVSVDASVSHIVRPVSAELAARRVVAHEPLLDAPLADAAAQLSASVETAEITSSVRAMYKRVGLDPTKHRPSSEALLRRVKRGEPLPRVNSLVDVINWCSVESQLPFGLYDATRIVGPVVLRLGQTGEAYPGIRKDEVHVEGRLVLADDIGPFGNPSSDSERTRVTESTLLALVVVFAPADLDPKIADYALAITIERVGMYCS
ncbi:MAG TPA: phenylalanine--tRNA ligase beta subunit-related protein [Vicinamibacterales bacterium]|nr:phenylalanine--tRNA ligase beta subunit-related protein [Vicinamibacterales bacterium]